MQLGWRNPFRGRPDDSFTDLQHKMLWPYVSVYTDNQAVSGSWTPLTWTYVEGDEDLVEGNAIRVPQDHALWYATGVAGVHFSPLGGAGARRLSWATTGRLEGAQNDTYSTGAEVDLQATLMRPMEANELLEVRAWAPVGGNTSLGMATIFFLPLT